MPSSTDWNPYANVRIPRAARIRRPSGETQEGPGKPWAEVSTAVPSARRAVALRRIAYRHPGPSGGVAMQWITRERVKVDRVACPWLITHFIDPQAEFVFVPPEQVLETARRTGAILYDVEGAELGHVDG